MSLLASATWALDGPLWPELDRVELGDQSKLMVGVGDLHTLPVVHPVAAGWTPCAPTVPLGGRTMGKTGRRPCVGHLIPSLL